MEEKYFIVTNQSNLYSEYMEYKENRELMHNVAVTFLKENNIEANEFSYSQQSLYIIPTESDIENFKSILSKPKEQNLRQFKKNSKIGKSWINLLNENNYKIKHKPILGFYFKNHTGKMRSRLFDINGIVYCSYAVYEDIETPEGFIEIKASEFWKIIEDHEERNKNNE